MATRLWRSYGTTTVNIGALQRNDWRSLMAPPRVENKPICSRNSRCRRWVNSAETVARRSRERQPSQRLVVGVTWRFVGCGIERVLELLYAEPTAMT